MPACKRETVTTLGTEAKLGAVAHLGRWCTGMVGAEPPTCEKWVAVTRMHPAPLLVYVLQR